MKRSLTLLGTLCAFALWGQNLQEITMEVKPFKRGTETEMQFIASNNTPATKTIVLMIPPRAYRSANSSIPVVKSVSQGRTNLVSIAPSGAQTQGYQNVFTYGCLKTEPKEIPYLLPVGAKKTTTVKALNSLPKLEQDGEEQEQVGFSFAMEAGDTIFAARRGVVVQVGIEGSIGRGSPIFGSNSRNIVVVEHEDCTYGKYDYFSGDIFLTAGEVVEAGDPLGIVEEQGKTRVQFTVLYPRLTREIMLTFRNVASTPIEYVYYVPELVSAEGIQKPASGAVLEGIHPEEIITYEMSKGQRKRWLRKQQKKGKKE